LFLLKIANILEARVGHGIDLGLLLRRSSSSKGSSV
jgi:hypothetical protein